MEPEPIDGGLYDGNRTLQIRNAYSEDHGKCVCRPAPDASPPRCHRALPCESLADTTPTK